MNMIIHEQLSAKCRAVEKDPEEIGVFSTGEQCAVALILGRLDLLPRSHNSALEAVARLGPEWFAICLDIQRNR